MDAIFIFHLSRLALRAKPYIHGVKFGKNEMQVMNQQAQKIVEIRKIHKLYIRLKKGLIVSFKGFYANPRFAL